MAADRDGPGGEAGRTVHGRARVAAEELAADRAGGAEELVELRSAARAMDALSVGYGALDADWRYIVFNETAAAMVAVRAVDVLGRQLWDLFPAALGSEFETRYREAVNSGQRQTFQAFYPAPLNIWVEVVAAPRPPGRGGRTCALEIMFADVSEHRAVQAQAELARQVERAATELAGRAAEQQAGLVAIAQSLAAARSQDDVLAVLAEQGRALLGANGCGLCLREQDGEHVVTLITDSYAEVRTAVQRVPADFPLPAIASAARGQVLFLPDRAAAEAAFPGSAAIYEGAGVQASAAVPLWAHGRLLGCLSVGFTEVRGFTGPDRELLSAFAALTAQSLDRLHALQAALDATAHARQVADQQRALNQIASALIDASSRADVLGVVSGQGRAMLGAAGAGLALVEPDGEHVQVLTTDYFSGQVQREIARLPASTPLPIVRAAVEGTTFFLADRAAADAAFPGCADIYAAAATEGSAEVPLRTGTGLLGTLSVAFAQPHDWLADERELLRAFAVLTAQAVERIDTRTREQAASAAVARFSETMQRSLLTQPVVPDHLQIAVRYAPAAAEAYVGGDWYDVLTTPDAATAVVIGDVAGHDRTAAAAMAQLRNMLRGIAYTSGGSPARVLTDLDEAATGLDVGVIATVLSARIEIDPARRGMGEALLRWSSAGHPPPLLVPAEGAVRYLEGRPDLLIGASTGVRRHDHEQVLHRGDVVLLFTDGLVERRRTHLDAGLTWLVQASTAARGGTPDELCDHLLAQVGGQLEDDVAMLAVRLDVPPTARG